MQKSSNSPKSPNPSSISDLEQQLTKYRTKKPKTKLEKSEHQKLKSNLTKLYNDNKKFITEFEKTNYQYLALMKSTNNFYKFFDHSALFYAHHIAPKLNLTAHLRPDGDFAHKSAIGFVSIREPAKITEALKTLNIKPLKTRDQTGNFLLFKLPWTFTEDQLTEMIEANHFKMQNFNHIVMVDNIIPVLFLQLEELLKAIYENVRGMGGPVERETFGYELIKSTAKMNHLYLDLTNGQTSKATCLKNLKIELSFVKYQTKLIADLKIWSPKTSARIAEIIIKIQDIIDREQKTIK